MICTSVAGTTESEMLRLAAPWPFAEFRFDAMQSPGQELAARLVMAVPRCIVTMRPNGRHSEIERVAVLSAAMEAGAAFVDIEHDMPAYLRTRLVETARRCGTEVIVSWHAADFPSGDELSARIALLHTPEVSWVKLACRVTTPAEVERLCALVTSDCRALPVGTGPLALESRVALLNAGVPWTWAAADSAHRCADNQPTVAELKTALGEGDAV